MRLGLRINFVNVAVAMVIAVTMSCVTAKFPFKVKDFHGNSLIEIQQREIAFPFTLMAKIERFCTDYNEAVIAALKQMLQLPHCVHWLVLSLRDDTSDQDTMDGYSLLKFYLLNGQKNGLTHSIYDPAFPLVHNPSHSFVWKVSFALLLPHPCGVPETAFFESLLSSVKLAGHENSREWLGFYLVVGIDTSCEDAAVVVDSYSNYFRDTPSVIVILTEFQNQVLLTEKFDFLSLVAYRQGCEFFMTLHHNTVILRPQVIWRGIWVLIDRSLLPNFEGFGFVLFPVSVESLSSCSPNDMSVECQSSVALYGRSHVELFILPLVSGVNGSDSSLLSSSSSSTSWRYLDHNGFNLLHCMSFYCEIYRGIKDSCETFLGYVTSNPNVSFPRPHFSPVGSDPSPSVFRDLQTLIFHRRLGVASWLSASSPYGFRYSTRSMVMTGTGGMFARPVDLNPEDTRENYHYREPSAVPDPSARVAFISAVYGGYESTLKPFFRQSIPSDFICFTDLPETIASHGWIIDRTPYHRTIRVPYDSPDKVNSLSHNDHPMNIGKFYKIAFPLIPRLQQYDVVIWLDGTIMITNATVAESLLKLVNSGESLMLFEHWRDGSLFDEAKSSWVYNKYNSTKFAGFSQPRQEIRKQYDTYLELGYDHSLWKQIRPSRPQYGLWITCFVGLNMRDPRIPKLLSLWYEHILNFTTQDQISFSFVTQALGVYPYSFPNDEVVGTGQINTWFFKSEHGL
jgi:hypothetical protein